MVKSLGYLYLRYFQIIAVTSTTKKPRQCCTDVELAITKRNRCMTQPKEKDAGSDSQSTKSSPNRALMVDVSKSLSNSKTQENDAKLQKIY